MPPFGFGMSMPNLRTVGAAAAPFEPVILVQENWVGSGLVGGKTPSPTNSGGGTWQSTLTQAIVEYGPTPNAKVQLIGGEPFTGEQGLFRHSVALTNATISTTPSIEETAPGDVYIWARSNPGPTGDITNGYVVYASTSNVSLWKMVSGIDTQLASAATSPNNLLTSLTVSGSTITVKISGVSVITVTDTDVSAAGYFGCGVQVTYGVDSWVPNRVGSVTIQTA